MIPGSWQDEAWQHFLEVGELPAGTPRPFDPAWRPTPLWRIWWARILRALRRRS